MHLELYFDGATEPTNPGGTGSWGWVLKDAVSGRTTDSGEGDIPAAPSVTNNIAEYYALGFGLKRICERTPEGLWKLTIKGDSKLVIYQVSGEWQCNKDHLRLLRDRCRDRVRALRAANIEVELAWVPRDLNAEADALTRHAWERATGRKFPERRRA